MKKLYPILILITLSVASYAQKRTKSEQAFIQSLEKIDDQELWQMREKARDKFQTNLVMGTIFTGWGLSGIGTGVIFRASGNRDLEKASNALVGSGFIITVIGGIITGTASKYRKNDLWIQKELWIREETSLSIGPGGIRLTF